jgi:hypothetical protein
MEKPMASDESDRSFDKAMARHLRSAAPSGDAVNRAADSLPQRASCPDTETLAAYHERSLLPEELNSWKEHIVGCAHCQELLAHLEATDDIPLHAAEEQEVFAMTDAQHSVAARSIEALPRPAAPSQDRRAAAAARPDRARVSRLAGRARWRWLAPAGAIAAGLLVWIAMHENHRPGLPSSDEIKMAKNQEPPAPAPPLLTPAPSAPPLARSSPSSSRVAAGDLGSYAPPAPAGNREERQVDEFRAKGALTKSSADKESGARKDAERESSANLILNEKQADLDAKAATDAVQQKIEVQAQAPAQDQNLQVQNQNNSPKAPGPAPLGQANTAKRMKAAPSPPPAAPAGVARGYAGGAVTETVMVSDPRSITAPGSNFVWRTGHAGLIEFSQDGGRSWARQPSGVIVDLLTGSAPSGQVCWIVGRVGAILLTTDGGAHWNLVSSPLKGDLGGVHATDALHATVWNVRSTKSFTTSDGGLTWNRVAKE